MKQTGLLTGIAFVALFASCNRITQLANINVNIPYSAQVTVPQVPGDAAGIPLPPGGISLPFPTMPIATNSQQYIAEYQTSAAKIVDVDLQSLALQILSPADQNFNFLDSVEIFISTSTLPEMLVAYAYDIPQGQTTLNLTTETNLNLKTYFIQDTIIFRMSAHINAIPASGTQLNIASTFHLLANPLD
jgi:hypothetical protein